MRTRLLCVLVAAACGEGAPSVTLERQWISGYADGCLFASPLDGGADVLVASRDGLIAALWKLGGGTSWSLQLPAPAGEVVDLAATPALVGEAKLVVVWQTTDGTRQHHMVGVVDLATHALDPAFPLVELTAELPSSDGGTVQFLPSNAYSRSAIQVARPAGSSYGLAYVSFGNIQDIQPWHGWVFELDLDSWSAAGAGAAITAVLLTTPESDCGPAGKSGAADMICGGGVWSPAGPIVVPAAGPDGFDLIVPTGNGQLDLGRSDYANTLMRIHGAGLGFDPRCDAVACGSFDPIEPAPECVASCEDLFIPRLLPGQPMFDPPDGRCDGKTFFECYAALDYDLGANTPGHVRLASGRSVFVLPAKDGAVYLIDGEHLGTLHDRRIIMEVCGSDGGSCSANWAGMMVTQPEVVAYDGTPVALISTFVHDTNHPAGIVALAIVEDTPTAAPRFEQLWEAPEFSSSEALERFRRHSGRPAFVDVGAGFVVVVDVGSDVGTLLVARISDGAIVARGQLESKGQRFVRPLVDGGRITITSCESDAGQGHVEQWLLRAD